MPFAENLAVFFDPAMFADAVVFGSGEDAVTWPAIFRNEYIDTEGMANQVANLQGEEATLPAITVGTTTLVVPANAAIGRAQATYKVVNRETDGTGVVRLILELVA